MFAQGGVERFEAAACPLNVRGCFVPKAVADAAARLPASIWEKQGLDSVNLTVSLDFFSLSRMFMGLCVMCAFFLVLLMMPPLLVVGASCVGET